MEMGEVSRRMLELILSEGRAMEDRMVARMEAMEKRVMDRMEGVQRMVASLEELIRGQVEGSSYTATSDIHQAILPNENPEGAHDSDEVEIITVSDNDDPFSVELKERNPLEEREPGTNVQDDKCELSGLLLEGTSDHEQQQFSSSATVVPNVHEIWVQESELDDKIDTTEDWKEQLEERDAEESESAGEVSPNLSQSKTIQTMKDIQPFCCGICDATFYTADELAACVDSHGHVNEDFAVEEQYSEPAGAAEAMQSSSASVGFKGRKRTAKRGSGRKKPKGVAPRKVHHCKLCAYSSDSKFNLLRHMIRHTGEKPYSCHLCNGRYSLKQHLNSHYNRVHLELTRYECHLCGKRFYEKKCLISHLTSKNVHGITLLPEQLKQLVK